MGIVHFDRDLIGHRKAHTVVAFAEIADLFVAAGLLSHKIVGRKAHDHQLFAIGLIKLLEPFVLRGQPTARSGIYDQDLFALEIREADVLLHVVDVSHPNFEEQILVVNKTLQEIKAGDKPTLIIFNKIDNLKEPLEIDFDEFGN